MTRRSSRLAKPGEEAAPPRTPTSTCLDHTVFPHLIDMIISYAPHASLLAFRGVSHAFCSKAEAKLFSHVIVTHNRHTGTVLSSPHGRLPAAIDKRKDQSPYSAAQLAHVRVADCGYVPVSEHPKFPNLKVCRHWDLVSELKAPIQVGFIDLLANDNCVKGDLRFQRRADHFVVTIRYDPTDRCITERRYRVTLRNSPWALCYAAYVGFEEDADELAKARVRIADWAANDPPPFEAFDPTRIPGALPPFTIIFLPYHPPSTGMETGRDLDKAQVFPLGVAADIDRLIAGSDLLIPPTLVVGLGDADRAFLDVPSGMGVAEVQERMVERVQKRLQDYEYSEEEVKDLPRLMAFMSLDEYRGYVGEDMWEYTTQAGSAPEE